MTGAAAHASRVPHPLPARIELELPDLTDLTDLAASITAEAGALALQMRHEGVSVASSKSSELDIVTQADTAVENLIRERISAARPDDGILGEETGEARGTSGLTWIVDPIDGTVNYLYGSPYWAVSIAVAARAPGSGWQFLLGRVFSPAQAVEYSATVAGPALRNGEPIGVNTDVPLRKALVSLGIPYDRALRQQVLHDIGALVPQVRDLRLVGAAALEICGVAEGRTDGHFQRGLPVWDYAAASVIARRAGATVVGDDGSPAAEAQLLLANPQLARELDALLSMR